MLKVAIIGISGYGEIHYNNLIRKVASSELDIIAATVINQEDEKEKCKTLKGYGCKLFTDYNEMLSVFAGKLDLVCIPTGINMHAPMAVAAMNAGADVLVEKPAAATVQEVKQMQYCERLTGRRVFVGFQHIYQKNVQDAKRMILSGELGKLKKIKSLVLSPRDHIYYTRNKWVGCLKSGNEWILDSPFNNATAHYLNIGLFWGGSEFQKSAEICACKAELYCANRIESPDTAAIKLKTVEGIDIFYYCSHAVKNNSGPKIEVICERGTLFLDSTGISLTYKNTPLKRLNCFDDLNINMFDSLIRHVRGDGDFVCDLEIAKQHTLAVNSAHDASAIKNIPYKYIDNHKCNKQVITYVKGLEELFLKCFKYCKMPFDCGEKWTSYSPSISIGNHYVFEGNKII